jgi:hypothetical protein
MIGTSSSPSPKRRLRSRIAIMFIAVVIAGSALARPGSSAVLDGYKTAVGIVVYLGVLPAAMVRGHAGHRGDAGMHGGVPRGRSEHHLVVAAFDAASGVRIEDADVNATVSEPGHIAQTRLRLEPMRVADTITYGGFAAMPYAGHYTISVEVRRPGAEEPARVEFHYQHAE